jgi:hypothetical protein
MADPLEDFHAAVDQLEADLEEAVGKALAVTDLRSSYQLEERRGALGELKAWIDRFWARHRALLRDIEGFGRQGVTAELLHRLATIADRANDQLTSRVELSLARFGLAWAIIDPRLARPRFIDRGIVAHPRAVDGEVVARPVD